MRRRALLIATSRYSDPRLPELSSALHDAKGLEEVLADSQIGDFSVEDCLDPPCDQLRHRIADFFAEGERDDLLLLYLSGHGVKDRGGKLYFAATDTNQERLLNTAIASSYINDAVNEGRSRRVVMIFDACFSGAFARDWEIKAGTQADVQESFRSSTGSFVITASDAIQYAHARSGQPSLFSKHLIEGLRTGKADMNGDGDVGVEELYQYVLAEVRHETSDQEPKRWVFGVNGDLVLAKNPAPPPGELPEDVQTAMMSALARVRLAAVDELERLLSAPARRTVLAAQQALLSLQENDNRAVSEAAEAALASAGSPAKAAEARRQAERDLEEAAARQAEQEQAARKAEQQAVAREAGALVDQGNEKRKGGDAKGAIADYTTAIQMRGAPSALVDRALLNRGVMKGQQGDTQGEIADYTTVIKRPGASPFHVGLALRNRGLRKGKQGDTQGEVADYTAAIQLPGATPDEVAKAKEMLARAGSWWRWLSGHL